MLNDYSISIYLDNRRMKKNGKYPVKLRVFNKATREQKLYPVDYEFSKEEFINIWETLKPKSEYRIKQLELQGIETRANEVASKLDEFSFIAFERAYFSINKSMQVDVGHYYATAIEQYNRNQQLGTASSYELSLKSLLEFHGKSNLNFKTITTQWLKDYEYYMISEKNRSKTTVGIYLRPLRAIFNTAIEDKAIRNELYPFGKRKYQIPSPKSVKKALNKEELKLLSECVPENEFQEKARDFFFFSYSCSGMNMKDIAYLQYKNISKDVLTYVREKTKNTNKSQRDNIAYLTPFAFSVIDKYGNPDKKPENLVFSIIHTEDTPQQKRKKVQNFVRYVNQHLKKLAKSLEIDQAISTYWARHSFATNALRNGASYEFIFDAFNHAEMKSTKNYIGSFADDVKRSFAKKMMEF